MRLRLRRRRAIFRRTRTRWPLAATIMVLIVLSLGYIASSAAQDASAAAPDKTNQQGAAVQANETPPAGVDALIADEDAPLYSPFTTRYILDELLRMRSEFERTRADLVERQVQREYEIAKDAAGYARHAVELFFFIITAVTTLLVFLGWNSLRDVRVRVSEVAESRVESLVAGYSERLDAIESELQQKTKRLKQAQNEIDETNEIHSLWLRASQETAPAGKIAVYDEILKLRPQDTEAMTFKADAALQLDEPQWALSLANRALAIDAQNAHAFYQRACAHAAAGAETEALADLEAAIGFTEAYRRQARNDPAFDAVKSSENFKSLTDVAEADA